MNNAVVKPNETAVSHMTQADIAAKMAALGLSGDDLQPARILLQYQMSSEVANGNAKTGDIFYTQTNTVIGGFDKPIEVIPFKVAKVFEFHDKRQSPSVIVQTLPFEGNSNKYRDGTDVILNGTSVRVILAFTVGVLLREECKTGKSFPATMKFKVTTAPIARTIADYMAKSMINGGNAYDSAFRIGVVKKPYNNTFYPVYTIAYAGKVNEDEARQAAYWTEKTAGISIAQEEEAPF